MSIQDEIEKRLAREIEKRLTQNCAHKFANANDGTGDKVCTICGKRAMQAVMRYGR